MQWQSGDTGPGSGAGRTRREADGVRGPAGGEEREHGRGKDGAEDLGRVAPHQTPLPEDLEAEGQDDHAQEAHQPVARAVRSAGTLARGTKPSKGFTVWALIPYMGGQNLFHTGWRACGSVHGNPNDRHAASTAAARRRSGCCR